MYFSYSDSVSGLASSLSFTVSHTTSNISLGSGASALFSTISFIKPNKVLRVATKEDLAYLMKDNVFVDFFNVYLNLPVSFCSIFLYTHTIRYNLQNKVNRKNILYNQGLTKNLSARKFVISLSISET